ncbi:alpha/beta hydrolase family protein [Variovorax sp. W2I14]|uniref:alpha/beta hydrolase family protein n=1 Tax=Variovorax sp. W2I14 TaxID=3042290 RepID=UPI003D1DAD5B
MSMLDGAIVLVAVVLALAAATTRRIGARAIVVLGAALLVACLVQVWREGFYWQYAAIYALLAALLVLAWRRNRPLPQQQRALAWLGRGGVAALAFSALLAWTFVPVPELPAPGGPYAVGSQVFRWIDPEREEPATDDPHDHRNVVVQAWYPAEPGEGTRPGYIDGLGRLPSWVSLIPGLAMQRYDRIDTHARTDAPVSAQRARWPVVLFSPGYGASRAFYSGLLADLASRGFVVLALDHPYEAPVVELADGRLATPIERFLPNDPDRTRYMSALQSVRAADLRYVADQVGRPDAFGAGLSPRLDPQRIAAIGHSFGGASAVEAAMGDARIRAVANLDGTLYGRAATDPMPVPFLLLESDHRETRHSQNYLQGNLALVHHLRAGGYRWQITEANHYSFTDVPLYLSAPARFAVAMLIGGSRGPARSQAASNDVLAAFLQEPLLDAPGDVDAAAARHPGLRGGAMPAALH